MPLPRAAPAILLGWRGRLPRGRTRTSWLHDEAGSSPVTAIGGVAMFLVFVLIATQTTIHLFGSSRVGALALEAATRGARADGAPCAAAIAWADQRLGGSSRMAVSCTAGPDDVEVRVYGPSPAPALALFDIATGLATLDRRASVRIETFR
ncbi:hypothetical protein [Salsipaludibacter albus]|uniref:hypothetical protein n=1 Tax=Salsipaludibacter albus TaxID=2849650 RepID=UPI001EE47BE6|nr:hypothetical protein [Salsipaludibacter albus]MBY5161827.1 hypothetical protein [Salsipaludibacter albus]